jgi:hypothetical protein
VQEFQVVTRCPPMVPRQTALHDYRKFIIGDSRYLTTRRSEQEKSFSFTATKLKLAV